MPRPEKGSQEAKDRMAHLRGLRTNMEKGSTQAKDRMAQLRTLRKMLQTKMMELCFIDRMKKL
jgi:hypothetical protein